MRNALVAVSLLCSITANAQDISRTLGGRKVSVWLPRSGEAAPLVIYSHGFGGCPTQPAYLLRALSRSGYVVISPRHRDAGCGRITPASRHPSVSFAEPKRWNDRTYADRRDDIRAVENALRSDPDLSARIDFRRVAYAGHSLGGYTALGLAGGWPAWTGETAPRAVLALCPYVSPFIQSNTLSGVRVPVMFQGGSLDAGITRTLSQKGGAYDAVKDAKYLLVFRNAGHLTWGGSANATHDEIVSYAVAFLDRYVKDMPASHTLTDAGDLTEMRYDSELGVRKGSDRR